MASSTYDSVHAAFMGWVGLIFVLLETFSLDTLLIVFTFTKWFTSLKPLYGFFVFLDLVLSSVY